MHRAMVSFAPFISLVVLALGCGPQLSGGPERNDSARSTGVKRIVAAVQDDIPMVYQKLNPSSRFRGVDGVQDLVAAGLTQANRSGESIAELAEASPSVENGLWILAPDGTMELTWHIKPGARWHDGVPFTADDLVFTLQVMRDPDLPIFGDAAYNFISGIMALDPQTVTVSWNRPFIHADWLFSTQLALPIAKHALEPAYRERKAGFTDEPYWGQEYVGAGPYKLKEWQLGSHLVVSAFDGFVLGRPKVDEIEVRFIPDDETLAANLLAGSVEVVLGRSISGPQAGQIVDAWRGAGHMDLQYSSWVALYPQFIDPNPPIMLNLQFRQAVLQAIDRQQLVDELLPGQSSVADSWLLPGQPQYKEIEARAVTHYPYDPRKAAELLAGLGYTRGSDGALMDRSGKPLVIEIRTTAGDDLREKILLASLDDWKQVGLTGTPVLVPRQQAQDLPYRATFPGFELNRNPPDERGLPNLQIARIPLPENEFRVTGNRSRYRNADLDSLVERYFTTIPTTERMGVMGQIVKHVSENLVILPIFYDAAPTLISNRLVNVGAGGSNGTQAWNAYEWDTKG
ncbi:MAG TPA: peptide ABC transporter substrate-binding protein [Chloroflexota bacterium]|nr:peptide ABC transporter substrate-binding protein [Chloroflexota bacterium]